MGKVKVTKEYVKPEVVKLQKLKKYKEDLTEKYKKRKIKEKFERSKRFIGRFNKSIEAKVVSKRILRQQPRATLRIRESPQEPYKSIYFKNEFENERSNLFWK